MNAKYNVCMCHNLTSMNLLYSTIPGHFWSKVFTSSYIRQDCVNITMTRLGSTGFNLDI